MSDQVGTPQTQDPPPIAGKITPESTPRPDWDRYFLNIAQEVSTRSPDPSTQHGCVLVDPEQGIVSTGYNGPVRGFPHTLVPTTRPEKYDYMIHAEDNACLFARRSLKGATAYITGPPCSACFRRLAQAGIVRIVHAGRSSKCVDEDQQKACEQMAAHLDIKVVEIKTPADRAIGGLTSFVDELEKSQKSELTEVLTQKMFDELPEYSSTLPTGTTIGKRWKRKQADGTWWMGTYVECEDPKMVDVVWRRIEITDLEKSESFEKRIESATDKYEQVMRNSPENQESEQLTFQQWWESDHSVECRSNTMPHKSIAKEAWSFAYRERASNAGICAGEFYVWWKAKGDEVRRVAEEGTASHEGSTRRCYICRMAWKAAGGAA